MSAININSILSSLSNYPVNSSAGSNGSAQKPLPLQPESKDTFSQGEWWKNRAVSTDIAGERSPFNVYSRSDVVPKVRVSGNGETASTSNTGESSGQVSSEKEPASSSQDNASAPSDTTKPSGEPLSEAEKALLKSLKKADQAVRAHEMAHLAAAGGLAKGGASFKTQKGPDGVSYAVGGEVQIDMSQGATPEITAQKMRIARRAALAPVDPSPQDQRVAAQATIKIAEATQELTLQKTQSPEAENTQAHQDSEDRGALSAGNIYQDYGKSVIQGNAERESSFPARKQQVSRYGQTVSSPGEASPQSALAIII